MLLTNPATTSQINRLVKPIYIMIRDVSMNYSNEAVVQMLENNNCKFTLNVKFSPIRDNDGTCILTTLTGIDMCMQTQIIYKNDPLPRFMHMILKNNSCTKYLKNEHPTWKCVNTEICDACKLPGHLPASYFMWIIYWKQQCLQFWWQKRPIWIV